jgi:MFS family permease
MQPYPPYGAPPQAMPPAYGMPPPGYAPPPAYYPPPPPPTFETREGVKYMSYNLLLQMISAVVGFVIGLAALAIVLSNASNWTAAATAALGGVVAAAAATIVIAIISFILFIVSLIKFYQGKMEYGPEHDKNVGRGILYWILSFIIPIIGSVVAAGVAVGMMFSGNLSDIANAFRVIIIIAGVMSVVGVLFTAMMYRTLVQSFTTDEAQKFKTGTILLILNPVVGLIIGALAIPGQIASGAQSGVSYISNIGGIIGLIGIWFFYQGYKSILAKMDTGVIRPMPMQAPMYPPGYAPPPMPPQPYQQQPYQPPMAPAPYQPQPPMAPPTPSCLTCGNPIPPGAMVCPRCGGRV